MSYDAHSNLALGTVTSPPAPALSGTSLILTAGDGAKFPAPPFNATLWPAGVRPSKANAEVVRVTAIAGETFSISRAQEGTSAVIVTAGFQLAATLTAQTIRDIEVIACNLPNIVIDGDSQSIETGQYLGNGNEWPAKLKLLSKFRNYSNWGNFAQSGMLVSNDVNYYDNRPGPSPGPASNRPAIAYSDRAIYFLWIGINDVRSDNVAATIFANIESLWARAKQDGFYVVAFTNPIWTDATFNAGRNTQRINLNNLIKGVTLGTFYDLLIDVDAFYTGADLIDGVHIGVAAAADLATRINNALPSMWSQKMSRYGGTTEGMLRLISPDNDGTRSILAVMANNLTAGIGIGYEEIKLLGAGIIHLFLQQGTNGAVCINKLLNTPVANSAFNVNGLSAFENGDLMLMSAGKTLKLKEGANACSGTVVLNGITEVTVSTTVVTAISRIQLTTNTPGGTPGTPYVSSRIAGTSFGVKSTNAADTSTVAWLIIEPS